MQGHAALVSVWRQSSLRHTRNFVHVPGIGFAMNSSSVLQLKVGRS